MVGIGHRAALMPVVLCGQWTHPRGQGLIRRRLAPKASGIGIGIARQHAPSANEYSSRQARLALEMVARPVCQAQTTAQQRIWIAR